MSKPKAKKPVLVVVGDLFALLGCLVGLTIFGALAIAKVIVIASEFTTVAEIQKALVYQLWWVLPASLGFKVTIDNIVKSLRGEE